MYDVAIIGGGIVGVATGMALTESTRASVVVLEAEGRLAAHQTGNNSGVIHSGLYYKPGSLKARNCVTGREAMVRFCSEHDVAHDRCGKIVVATEERELPALEELERRGQANGLHGLRRLRAEELRDYEPHVSGIAGLHVPETGIVDFAQVTEKMADRVRLRQGEVRTGARVRRCIRRQGELVLDTTAGEVRCRNLINCGGLQCDRVARRCGVNPGLQIVPFRGKYYELIPERHSLVKNLIYPVPDPRFPFLGVHFTRMIHGGIEAGPNAVLSFRRGVIAHSVSHSTIPLPSLPTGVSGEWARVTGERASVNSIAHSAKRPLSRHFGNSSRNCGRRTFIGPEPESGRRRSCRTVPCAMTSASLKPLT